MDRDAELAALKERGLPYVDRLIAAMYIYARDLDKQARIYAQGKAEHDRLKARAVMARRYDEHGNVVEKSGEMCATLADAQDDVFAADLAYRTAEQLITADRETLKIMHAELDKWRTEQANERAADSIHRSTGV